uniref:ankyrin-3-like n=1 Tax=Fragaria vesca subsp. vesca TaxID=101020 RepID=UPI0005CAFF38|nr:PREDICTED: ankyrin-3-like [Fragaria vesca subsp. vesca]
MDPELYEAVTLGDTKILGRIRGAGEWKTPNESNIFHIAAEFKQIEFFKKVPLDEQSFQLFWAVNKKGDTPLHVAARAGCNEIVRLLIDQPKTLHNGRADQERGQSDGEAQKELLQMTNKNQDTALHVATRYRHFEVVKLLVEANPQLCGLTNNSNESPLFVAIRQDFLVAADVFIKSSVPPSFEGINGVTALHAAVNLTDKEAEVIVKDLVGKYPETITKTDQLGWTPLHYAALSGNVEASRVLVQGSTSVTYMLDRSGMSALHVAAYAGQTKVMEEFIRRRPDSCHLVNHKGQTILHTAVMGGVEDREVLVRLVTDGKKEIYIQK